MKISIITVSFNSEKTIRDTIESVLGQEYNNVEYIIIDGLSSDKTIEIIKSFGDKIQQFISEPDKGIYDAMNKGIFLATGDVIGILNSDDFYTNQQVLKNVALKFENNIDAVYADLVYVNHSDSSKIVRTWISKPYQAGMFLKGWMPPHPTFFLRKECYSKFGFFNTTLKSAADYELMLRMIHKNKIKVNYLNEVIVKMRAGGQSNVSIKNRIKANKEDRLAWKINNLKPAPFTFLRKPLSKLTQFLKK